MKRYKNRSYTLNQDGCDTALRLFERGKEKVCLIISTSYNQPVNIAAIRAFMMTRASLWVQSVNNRKMVCDDYIQCFYEDGNNCLINVDLRASKYNPQSQTWELVV